MQRIRHRRLGCSIHIVVMLALTMPALAVDCASQLTPQSKITEIINCMAILQQENQQLRKEIESLKNNAAEDAADQRLDVRVKSLEERINALTSSMAALSMEDSSPQSALRKAKKIIQGKKILLYYRDPNSQTVMDVQNTLENLGAVVEPNPGTPTQFLPPLVFYGQEPDVQLAVETLKALKDLGFKAIRRYQDMNREFDLVISVR